LLIQLESSQINAFKECVAQRNEADVEIATDQCALLFELLSVTQEKVYFHCDQLLRGMYTVYLERWLRFFPKSSFLLIKSEDFFQNPNKTISNIFDFFQVWGLGQTG
jgi:hypothetical protein